MYLYKHKCTMELKNCRPCHRQACYKSNYTEYSQQNSTIAIQHCFASPIPKPTPYIVYVCCHTCVQNLRFFCVRDNPWQHTTFIYTLTSVSKYTTHSFENTPLSRSHRPLGWGTKRSPRTEINFALSHLSFRISHLFSRFSPFGLFH